jgi:hypothetical protein
MNEYNLDATAAKNADNFYSKIEQKGKYFGIITRAEAIKSKKGATGIDLSFQSDTGETADYLTIWTHNADDKELMGYNLLMALMTCLRVKNLKPELGQVEKYDYDTKKRGMVTVNLFKDLMGKQIGFLIRMEEYQKTDGGTAWKPVISSVFDKDEFTATEILNKSVSPESLTKRILALKDKPLTGVPMTQTNVQNSSNPFDDLGADIPF